MEAVLLTLDGMQPSNCYCRICTVSFNSRSCCMFSLSEQKVKADGIREIKTTYGSKALWGIV